MDALKDRLHPETLAHIKLAQKLGTKLYYDYETIELARQAKNETSPHFRDEIKDFVGESLEVRVPSKDVPGKQL